MAETSWRPVSKSLWLMGKWTGQKEGQETSESDEVLMSFRLQALIQGFKGVKGRVCFE